MEVTHLLNQGYILSGHVLGKNHLVIKLSEKHILRGLTGEKGQFEY